ncbi:hypothetical protein WJX74_008340 [Apatococcus lobatus]|uniref:Uncharacterized protein n=1 Tax=Apatococcus lobatus TaxID=904363 RepID=A0AAW1S0C9_9CHLO
MQVLFTGVESDLENYPCRSGARFEVKGRQVLLIGTSARVAQGKALLQDLFTRQNRSVLCAYCQTHAGVIDYLVTDCHDEGGSHGLGLFVRAPGTPDGVTQAAERDEELLYLDALESTQAAAIRLAMAMQTHLQFHGLRDQREILEGILQAIKQAADWTPASGGINVRLSYGQQFFYTIPSARRRIPVGEELSLDDINALEIGRDPRGIRSVFSNAVAGDNLEALRATAREKLGFVLIEDKATASIHLSTASGDHKVMSFSRSGDKLTFKKAKSATQKPATANDDSCAEAANEIVAIPARSLGDKDVQLSSGQRISVARLRDKQIYRATHEGEDFRLNIARVTKLDKMTSHTEVELRSEALNERLRAAAGMEGDEQMTCLHNACKLTYHLAALGEMLVPWHRAASDSGLYPSRHVVQPHSASSAVTGRSAQYYGPVDSIANGS